MDKEHALQAYIRNNFPNVSKLTRQLSYEQCLKLVQDFDKKLIAQTLEEMDNYKPLTKKYTSVYLTLRKWIKINLDKEAKSKSRGKGIEMSYAEALAYLQRNGMGNDIKEHFEPVHYENSEKPVWRKK